jgi:hypothetical protein
MTVEFISVEEYKKIMAELDSMGYYVRGSIISHQGCLYQISDMYKGTWLRLVPDTGLMRVLV